MKEIKNNIFKVWCMDFNQWEKHPVCLMPSGEILHFENERWILVRKITMLLFSPLVN